MKIAVEFPSVVYRDGPEGAVRLAKAIEDIGYDQLDMFDHVVMGHPTDGRPAGPVSAQDADPRGADDARLLRRGHAQGRPRHRGAGAAAAPSDAGGEADLDARHAVGRPRAAGRRRRLAGVGVRRAGRRLPRARRADGRVDRAAAPVLERRPRRRARTVLSDEGDRDGAQAAAGRRSCRSGSAARRRRRCGARAGSATAGSQCARRPTSTRRAATSPP